MWRADKTIIHPEEFNPGKNFQCGSYTIIDDDVQIGDNVRIGCFVRLKEGTIIGDNVWIDDYSVSSGECIIEDNVVIRYKSIIARNVRVRSGAYISPMVSTAYLDHSTVQSVVPLVIGSEAFIGTGVIILPRGSIAKGVVVGAGSVVTKPLDKPFAIYHGIPAIFQRYLNSPEIRG